MLVLSIIAFGSDFEHSGVSITWHQGSAMDVLARIESVNMYWYVWVCIWACILVRIGMYKAGTY